MILQLLGSFIHYKGKRQKEILQFAKNFLVSKDNVLRSRAIMVIGWLGEAKDIKLLSEFLFNDKESENRSLAATSMSQIFYNKKEVGSKALSFLKKGLENEKSTIALQGILMAIQQITGKKLGVTNRHLWRTN